MKEGRKDGESISDDIDSRTDSLLDRSRAPPVSVLNVISTAFVKSPSAPISEGAVFAGIFRSKT